MFIQNQRTELKRAIGYFRHSAEDRQENSVLIQKEKAEEYCRKYNIELIGYEADEGKSGLLGPEGRPGLSRILEYWAGNPSAPRIDYVVIYDESRWGRFQEPDKAAYYTIELLMRRNIRIIYFENNISPEEKPSEMSHLILSMKRSSAASYSRQLSGKVINGCIKVTQQGYSAGGSPCYGMSRLMLDAEKKPMYILKAGEHKAISNARIVFVPSEDDCTEIVRLIFQFFIKERKNLDTIAQNLNRMGKKAPRGGTWKRGNIMRILTNPIYVGTRVYNKTTQRLKTKRRSNPKDQWVVAPNCFQAIIDEVVFREAQERLQFMRKRYRHSVYLFRNAKRQIQQELKQLAIQRENTSMNTEISAKALAMLFSITRYEDTRKWSFVVRPNIFQHPFVIAIGIGRNKADCIEQCFAIPTTELSHHHFYSIREGDERFISFKADSEKIKSVLNTQSEISKSLSTISN